MIKHLLAILGISVFTVTFSADSAIAIGPQDYVEASPAVSYTLVVDTSGKAIESGAEKFVDDLTKRGIGFLSNQSLSHEKRKDEFRRLLQSGFDLKTIGRFTLGRYWRNASASEQEEYLKLFEDSIVNSYAKRFSEYQGQDIKITGSQKTGADDVLVHSSLVLGDGPDVKVDWRVRKKGGSYKVIDVIVEGVSMAVTQRADFASVIQRGGGQVEVLLAHLRK